MTTQATIAVRLWREGDSITALTDLLHRAYKPLADAGMRFIATHQDDEMTRRRISTGQCFVAEREGSIVGTINFRPPGIAKGTPWYERPGVAYFGQFAVEPAEQSCGVGSMLLSFTEAHALAEGAVELACDTSDRAEHLIQYYATRGYRFIEHVRWPDVNYRSVVLSKRLASAPGENADQRAAVEHRR